MKIIHVEGGLGNQMACYAVYVAAKESNPDDVFYIDTYLYDVTEAHSTISMWNGYELNKVFGVEIQDIRSLFTREQVKEQIDYLRKSEFWKHDWNYAEVFIEMMKNYGIYLNNAYGHVEEPEQTLKAKIKYALKKLIAGASSNRVTYTLKHAAYMVYNKISGDCGEYLFKERKGDYFYDITLDFMKSQFLYDQIGYLVREDLQFNEPDDEENRGFLKKVRETNSVSIHVRRTDFLQFNEDCYKFGYFKKCVSYIKQNVESPTFFIFSDDLKWCQDNLDTMGLNAEDNVSFVGINTGKTSYRDMQIMANCKNNIATKSSFGWWGSFLNGNPNKITCCQIGSYVSTKQF